jgi:hypothetical protein
MQLIDFDWESTAIEVKTSVSVDSGKAICVKFFTTQIAVAAAVMVNFIPGAPTYVIGGCSHNRRFETAFPVIPPGKEMIWRFTKTKTSNGDFLVQFHCNGKEMVNVKLDATVCTQYNNPPTLWKVYWDVKAEKIFFDTNIDSASEYYRSY